MQIIVQVPDDVCQIAEAQQIPVIDLVELFMVHGMRTLSRRLVFLTAIERIRVLRSAMFQAQR